MGAIFVPLDEKQSVRHRTLVEGGEISVPAYHHVRWRGLITERMLVLAGACWSPGTSRGKSRGTRSTAPCVWCMVHIPRGLSALKGSLRVSF